MAERWKARQALDFWTICAIITGDWVGKESPVTAYHTEIGDISMRGRFEAAIAVRKSNAKKGGSEQSSGRCCCRGNDKVAAAEETRILGASPTEACPPAFG